MLGLNRFLLFAGVCFGITLASQSSFAQDCPCGPPTMSAQMRGLLIPQEFAGIDIRPACRTHDKCYGTPGANRKSCDQQFRKDLTCMCKNSTQPIACRNFAKAAYWAERLFGKKSYLIRQGVIRPKRVYLH